MARPYFPSEALTAALAAELSKSPLFQGDALAEVYKWVNDREDGDFALVFEGGREEVIRPAWEGLGMRLKDAVEEEVSDPEGLMMWRSHVALELAFFTLVGRTDEVERLREANLAQGLLEEDPSDLEA